MPVDKFGRMSDTKTKDTGVSLTYINNNYVRNDGGTPLTGSLDMRGNTIYNVADPVNPQNVVTKEYVDNVKGSGGGVSPFYKENGEYKATHRVNMMFNKLVNLHKPIEPYDAATEDYVDYNVETLKARTHIIAVNTRYCGVLKNGEYPFKFSNNNFGICEEKIERYKDFKGLPSGFVMPQSGRIKKIICESLTYVEYDEIIDGVMEDMLKQPGVSIDPNDPHRWPEWHMRLTTREGFSKDIFEDKLKIGVKPNEDFFFKIVRFEKRLNLEDYPIDKNQPKIISSVLVEKFNLADLGFGTKSSGIGAIINILNHDYKTLLEGDVINIEVAHTREVRFPEKKEFEIYSDGLIYNVLKDKSNFNFTFLIELDPL